MESFLQNVKSVDVTESKSSKQDFFVELIGNQNKKIKLRFHVRTNKPGDEHKLGQFFNLAVKFNGLV